MCSKEGLWAYAKLWESQGSQLLCGSVYSRVPTDRAIIFHMHNHKEHHIDTLPQLLIGQRILAYFVGKFSCFADIWRPWTLVPRTFAAAPRNPPVNHAGP
jgi:hypothetical protein